MKVSRSTSIDTNLNKLYEQAELSTISRGKRKSEQLKKQKLEKRLSLYKPDEVDGSVGLLYSGYQNDAYAISLLPRHPPKILFSVEQIVTANTSEMPPTSTTTTTSAATTNNYFNYMPFWERPLQTGIHSYVNSGNNTTLTTEQENSTHTDSNEALNEAILASSRVLNTLIVKFNRKILKQLSLFNNYVDNSDTAL